MTERSGIEKIQMIAKGEYEIVEKEMADQLQGKIFGPIASIFWANLFGSIASVFYPPVSFVVFAFSGIVALAHVNKSRAISKELAQGRIINSLSTFNKEFRGFPSEEALGAIIQGDFAKAEEIIHEYNEKEKVEEIEKEFNMRKKGKKEFDVNIYG